ncbi:2'-5' RNA ligase [Alkalithermobacter thermoalcaliphilus JW-YL-7 = DSM 7308]|uniref:RNA 2',3'-cyclic phosphodiesterase n=1 Tax=Alkalithermobacter thermoalcaliphilus JW-YL-7 = DSM 7308 TaxID=1121328 RepID=A0A150FQD3_CLOPD|nr:2'-5' RNA ligase [[Clostridium] paradoxum JW-YL-7 = DSM 7308]SHK86481.1 2'-5' RNA ligase [[Clostridium] paradoxum JW-YL-7 = DSM 7308]
MRVFLAIELNEEVIDKLSVYQNYIRKHSIKGNFTDKDNFHITIKFIGEINEEKLKDIKDAMDTIRWNNPFVLRTEKIGCFPRKDKKIVWVGVGGETDKLNSLFKEVENVIYRKGFKKEDRPYSPHITIGREVILNRPLESIQNEVNITSVQFLVKELSLMESCRENGKLVYKTIYKKSFLES